MLFIASHFITFLLHYQFIWNLCLIFIFNQFYFQRRNIHIWYFHFKSNICMEKLHVRLSHPLMMKQLTSFIVIKLIRNLRIVVLTKQLMNETSWTFGKFPFSSLLRFLQLFLKLYGNVMQRWTEFKLKVITKDSNSTIIRECVILID